jgi:hypothetical protein
MLISLSVIAAGFALQDARLSVITDACAKQLALDCPDHEKSSSDACLKCAESHGKDLKTANCTAKEVEALCKHAFPPLPTWSRIMPLGDSITFGCGDQCEKDCMVGPKGMAPCSNCSGGYRTPLYNELHNASFNFSFVGTKQNGPPSILSHMQHEGHPGIYFIFASQFCTLC